LKQLTHTLSRSRLREIPQRTAPIVTVSLRQVELTGFTSPSLAVGIGGRVKKRSHNQASLVWPGRLSPGQRALLNVSPCPYNGHE